MAAERCYSPPMLVLWDIDGTLLRTHGAGSRAMDAAGRELLGPQFSLARVDLAGQLDSAIWLDACQRNGVAASEELMERLRAAYTRQLRETYEREPPPERLHGAASLCASFASHRGVTQGLLTGNYSATGRIKVHAAGYDLDQFQVCAWGSDAESRRALVPVALARYEELHGRAIDPKQVTIIGDTPRDVDCARASGCRSIAVATGRFSLADLLAEEPDLALQDLRDTARVLDFIGVSFHRARAGG